jgi:hypothetical protein
MFNPLNHTQAKAVAKAIHELRPEWDVDGIVHHLGLARARGDGFDVAVAAMRAAHVVSNRTPAVISLDGAHWRDVVAKPGPPKHEPSPGKHERCTTCSEREDDCRRKWSHDHDYQPAVQVSRRADVATAQVNRLRQLAHDRTE